MRRFFSVTLLSASVLLTACNFSFGGGTESSSSSSSVSSEEVTRNVSYEGMVEDIGATVYQQGTHKLVLDDGRFILLESNDPALDLSLYLSKKVEVRGDIMPTVEAGGSIMRVSQVIVLDEASSSSSENSSSKKMCGGIAALPCDTGYSCVDDPSDSCDPANGGADCGGVCLPVINASSALSSASSITSSPTPPASSAANSAVSVAASSVSSDAASSVSSDALEANIVAMAKDTYADPARWTQKYCTSHIGFCVAVHKNWFYQSFGATNGSLWHVEFDLAAPETLLSGPIQLNLLSGTSASAGGVSGQVSTKGSRVIGYFDWDSGKHFEISADARLAAAVSYMIAHLEPYATPTQ